MYCVEIETIRKEPIIGHTRGVLMQDEKHEALVINRTLKWPVCGVCPIDGKIYLFSLYYLI